jgi:hypothetical protein
VRTWKDVYSASHRVLKLERHREVASQEKAGDPPNCCMPMMAKIQMKMPSSRKKSFKATKPCERESTGSDEKTLSCACHVLAYGPRGCQVWILLARGEYKTKSTK